MAVTLNSTIPWKTPTPDDKAMLENLQPNILKPHTRDFMSILFLKFDGEEAGRSFLRQLVAQMKSAIDHLQEVDAFHNSQGQQLGTPYVGLGLTPEAYRVLGIEASKVPADPSFKGRMQGTKALNDPPVADWEPHFRDPANLHAVVLVGDGRQQPMSARLQAVTALISQTKGVSIVGTQEGRGLHNTNGDGIEHFGYVDGRSQPLFFKEDLETERLQESGIGRWDPSAPLEDAIVSDPAAPDPTVHFGSYFIFRKLEQNVRRFKEEEEKFAEALATAGAALNPQAQFKDGERAGAMLVGRFEDGTPLTMQSADGMHSPVTNNFDYGGAKVSSDDKGNGDDGLGAKCPFFAHVRRTNPRGSGGREAPEIERRHQMPRRGQTYGVRTDNPNDGETANKPEGDVGLLFMAFNSKIGNQFEFMQIAWANSDNFPFVDGGQPHGIDPIIGQMPWDILDGQVPKERPRPGMTCPVEWGKSSAGRAVTVNAMPRTVTMKGGEYFFMPSLAFLRAL